MWLGKSCLRERIRRTVQNSETFSKLTQYFRNTMTWRHSIRLPFPLTTPTPSPPDHKPKAVRRLSTQTPPVPSQHPPHHWYTHPYDSPFHRSAAHKPGCYHCHLSPGVIVAPARASIVESLRLSVSDCQSNVPDGLLITLPSPDNIFNRTLIVLWKS